MATIRFTIEDSDVWHEITIDYQMTKTLFRDEHDLSYIIKREQDRCNEDWKNRRAKRVEVYDDNGKLIAKSSDILEWNKLEYINYENNEKE